MTTIVPITVTTTVTTKVFPTVTTTVTTNVSPLIFVQNSWFKLMGTVLWAHPRGAFLGTPWVGPPPPPNLS